MDISTITDINTLKAMAYDQIAAKEQAERNLNAINQRIAALTQMTPEEVQANLPHPKDPTAPADEPATSDSDKPDAPADETKSE